jgi:hypothetical protein
MYGFMKQQTAKINQHNLRDMRNNQLDSSLVKLQKSSSSLSDEIKIGDQLNFKKNRSSSSSMNESMKLQPSNKHGMSRPSA